MISTVNILFIIIVHYLADFVFQNDYMSKKKYKDITILYLHTLTYTALWGAALSIYAMFSDEFGLVEIVQYCLMTYGTHTIIDYISSKITHKKFNEEINEYKTNRIPNTGALAVVGLDQVLHYVQLILCWVWLM